MPVLITAHSLSRNDGDVWLDKAVTRTDSFPHTDADTSARYCRTSQHSVPDPPASPDYNAMRFNSQHAYDRFR